ncbi:hypothetical protein [Clostridium folliculivorans]|uniref:Spermidine synthase n=1 Tax=Clostridium folliculivorans TaxID=2886038 RepID=A0A9W6DCK3_9CLOT|nr:hypothetical protein [Clostridium folliculivorans]GKU27091.1 hypothetical protein CFOLD11_39180 [Clostridium folliculivorans]GKU31708.1 hypothetical protein CFB3_38150 [Clostridium folliculivorans]
MIPFEEEFYIDKLKIYYDKFKNAKFNNLIINENYLNRLEGYLFLENELSYNNDKLQILELTNGERKYMQFSPKEVQGSFEAIKRVKGKVGVVGLGMGYFLQEILKKEEVTDIVVYEKDKDVISLYEANFSISEKVKLINCDAFEAQRETFDFFYVDIYNYELSKDVVNHFIKFNELHNIENYLFWGMEHFLLSCKVEEIAWVYVPELWMEMARDLFERFNDSKYIQYFKQLDENLVECVLNEFTKVL